MSNDATTSPIGSSVQESARRRSRNSADYHAEQRRLEPYEALARIIIKRRAELRLTQQEVAKRMGSSHSAVSRIESGQHATKPETLRRLAEALDLRFVMGFESGPVERPTRDLVAV